MVVGCPNDDEEAGYRQVRIKLRVGKSEAILEVLDSKKCLENSYSIRSHALQCQILSHR